MSWDTHILYLRLVMLITAHDNCAMVHVNCARRTDLRRGVTNYIRQIDARAMRGHSNTMSFTHFISRRKFNPGEMYSRVMGPVWMVDWPLLNRDRYNNWITV